MSTPTTMSDEPTQRSPVGLSTYAFFWQHSDRVERPLTLADMLERTAEHGVDVFQICDFPAVLELDAGQRAQVRSQAERLGLRLELGTRGVEPAVLAAWLQLARDLDVTVVRSMLYAADSRPTAPEAVELLGAALPGWEQAGVTLALETYEQVPTSTLVEVVRTVGSANLGICTDPANCVAALELPGDVLELARPYVKNMHVKDFRFTRQAGWVGFSLVGAPLGEGLLDYRGMVERLAPGPEVSQIVEHWLPWQDTPEETCAVEQQWTAHNVAYLRSMQS
jgi:sugar phosphate isomerase/epimerase